MRWHHEPEVRERTLHILRRFKSFYTSVMRDVFLARWSESYLRHVNAWAPFFQKELYEIAVSICLWFNPPARPTCVSFIPRKAHKVGECVRSRNSRKYMYLLLASCPPVFDSLNANVSRAQKLRGLQNGTKIHILQNAYALSGSTLNIDCSSTLTVMIHTNWPCIRCVPMKTFREIINVPTPEWKCMMGKYQSVFLWGQDDILHVAILRAHCEDQQSWLKSLFGVSKGLYGSSWSNSWGHSSKQLLRMQ